MNTTRLMDFVKIVRGEFMSGDPHACFAAVSVDTRTLASGDCFFALSGPFYDGHDYIKDAVSKNAAAIVFSRRRITLSDDKISLGLPAIIKVEDTLRALGDYAAFARRAFDARVAVVAGSNGKTTVKNMLSAILSSDGDTHKSPGNYNNLVGLPLSILGASGDEKYVVLEAGISVKGEMARMGAISSPDIVVMTNIGSEHLAGFTDLAGVFKEEMILLDFLRPGGVAVLNMDDERLSAASRGIRKSVIRYCARPESVADITASSVSVSPDGVSFKLDYGAGEILDIRLNINGVFNVSNALAAASAAKAFGVPALKVKKGLESFTPVEGRMQILKLPNGCVIINDAYNANPDSMRAALWAFCDSYAQRSKILILGDMLELGESETAEHESLADFIMTLPFDEVLLVGERMRLTARRMKILHEDAPVKHLADAEFLSDVLRAPKYSEPSSAVFFKASHSVGLSSVAAKLYADRSREI
ncbi:MAG: UDP-N-acetylmuramoyl-tripeptide--D-alanyl-D-alanine ligase [Endomicrobiia bacterium]|nr:UDP-N-acetylmuramoyl-tripeptide--D-alanyl-D-alanine ligase [Endomicrobiia bacterium]